MKNICLIRDERPYWNTIERYLGGVNAKLHVLDGEPVPEKVLVLEPDLVVSNARSHHGMVSRLRQIPIIVLKEGTPPVALVRKSEERNLMISGWPLERGHFLEITSKMLAIAPRRIFRTLIRIFTEGDDIGALGQSRDFSLTGVAFKTEKDLHRGDRVVISFSLPEVNESLRLEAEIVRNAPDKEDGRNLYGARFLTLAGAQEKLLHSFILHS